MSILTEVLSVGLSIWASWIIHTSSPPMIDDETEASINNANKHLAAIGVASGQQDCEDADSDNVCKLDDDCRVVGQLALEVGVKRSATKNDGNDCNTDRENDLGQIVATIYNDSWVTEVASSPNLEATEETKKDGGSNGVFVTVVMVGMIMIVLSVVIMV